MRLKRMMFGDRDGRGQEEFAKTHYNCQDEFVKPNPVEKWEHVCTYAEVIWVTLDPNRSCNTTENQRIILFLGSEDFTKHRWVWVLATHISWSWRCEKSWFIWFGHNLHCQSVLVDWEVHKLQTFQRLGISTKINEASSFRVYKTEIRYSPGGLCKANAILNNDTLHDKITVCVMMWSTLNCSLLIALHICSFARPLPELQHCFFRSGTSVSAFIAFNTWQLFQEWNIGSANALQYCQPIP